MFLVVLLVLVLVWLWVCSVCRLSLGRLSVLRFRL